MKDQTEVVTLFPFDGITALRAIYWLAFNDGRSGVIGNNINYKSGPGHERREENREERKGEGRRRAVTLGGLVN